MISLPKPMMPRKVSNKQPTVQKVIPHLRGFLNNKASSASLSDMNSNR